MNINLVRATIDDAEMIWKIQVESFMQLLEKYQDMDTNPANGLFENVRGSLFKNSGFTKLSE